MTLLDKKGLVIFRKTNIREVWLQIIAIFVPALWTCVSSAMVKRPEQLIQSYLTMDYKNQVVTATRGALRIGHCVVNGMTR